MNPCGGSNPCRGPYPSLHQQHFRLAPAIVPGTPDEFHTAVPQTPLEPPTEFPDYSEMTSKREKKQQLDMINVSLRLLKLQRDEALTRNNKEAAMILMRSMDNTQEEKHKLEDELKACDTSEGLKRTLRMIMMMITTIMQKQHKIRH